MKKSNIIVVAFSAFIVISILIFYIDGKKHTKKENTTFETVQLPDFSVIVVEDNADVHIRQSDTIRLKIELKNDSIAKEKNYSIANDTLHLYKGNRIFVYNKNTTSVIANNAYWVGISFEKTDSLYIESNNSREIVLNMNTKECKVEKLFLNIQNTKNFYIYDGLDVKTFQVNLKKSELNIMGGKFKNASINLSDSSYLQNNEGKNLENIIIKKDETSHLNVYD